MGHQHHQKALRSAGKDRGPSRRPRPLYEINRCESTDATTRVLTHVFPAKLLDSRHLKQKLEKQPVQAAVIIRGVADEFDKTPERAFNLHHLEGTLVRSTVEQTDGSCQVQDVGLILLRTINTSPCSHFAVSAEDTPAGGSIRSADEHIAGSLGRASSPEACSSISRCHIRTVGAPLAAVSAGRRVSSNGEKPYGRSRWPGL